MRPVDYTYRRHAAANALLKTVLRKRRAAVQDLDDQVRATLRFQEQPVTQLSGYEEIIETWCDDLNLGCEAIRSEALDVVLTRGRNLEERTGEDDSAPFYNLGLTRFGGHLPKGGYDVPTDGRHTQAPAAPAVR